MEKEPVMTASDVGYDRLYTWIKQRLGPVHTTVCRTVAWAVLCLLLAQRATPAVLARALPAEQAGSGRACLRRVRRWWNGPPLDQAHISPRLVQMASASFRQAPASSWRWTPPAWARGKSGWQALWWVVVLYP